MSVMTAGADWDTRFDVSADGWTTDDLDELPEDGIRRELVDGAMIVSPAPTPVHQYATGELYGCLKSSLRSHRIEEWLVLEGVEVRFNRRRSLAPDISVIASEVVRRHEKRCTPNDVLLAVEVVSPSSRQLDRLLKPNLYASAGISHYWRVELEPEPKVHAYELDLNGRVYQLVDSSSTELKVALPWPIELSVTSLAF